MLRGLHQQKRRMFSFVPLVFVFFVHFCGVGDNLRKFSLFSWLTTL